jgi:integrase
VFATRRGGPIERAEYWRSWKAILRQAQVRDAWVRDARVHDARHTAATPVYLRRLGDLNPGWA